MQINYTFLSNNTVSGMKKINTIPLISINLRSFVPVSLAFSWGLW